MRSHEQPDHGTHDHQRDEVRHVGNRLNGFSVPLALDLVEQQREDDRNREAKDQARKADGQRVGQNAGEVVRLKEFDKMLKAVASRPGASENALSGRKVLERK